ncbi:hypothetical protein B0H13DRAFT_1932622 [Mycena leptocephala]|nr:hypothetical protein B0H13DRAFT_1932622 [Mycena leptocephala]
MQIWQLHPQRACTALPSPNSPEEEVVVVAQESWTERVVPESVAEQSSEFLTRSMRVVVDGLTEVPERMAEPVKVENTLGRGQAGATADGADDRGTTGVVLDGDGARGGLGHGDGGGDAVAGFDCAGEVEGNVAVRSGQHLSPGNVLLAAADELGEGTTLDKGGEAIDTIPLGDGGVRGGGLAGAEADGRDGPGANDRCEARAGEGGTAPVGRRDRGGRRAPIDAVALPGLADLNHGLRLEPGLGAGGEGDLGAVLELLEGPGDLGGGQGGCEDGGDGGSLHVGQIVGVLA